MSRCGFFILTTMSRRLPIFTSRFQLTILGTSELNCCVRNGNRWNLTVIVTDHMTDTVYHISVYLSSISQKDVPSKLNNPCYFSLT